MATKRVFKQTEIISYKNLDLIKKYTSERGKILPVRLTGLTQKKQRDLSKAVKRARFLALIAPVANNSI